MFPDAPATGVRYVTHLSAGRFWPLHGWVDGPEVYFKKNYRGTHYGGYQIGDKLVGFEKESHAVHYGGRVSSDGQEIEGKWWIEDTAGDATRPAEGAFHTPTAGSLMSKLDLPISQCNRTGQQEAR